MKKLVSLLFKIIFSLVGVVILGLVLVLVFFPNEFVRKKAEEVLTKQLSRQVTIEKSGFNIIKGIYIKNVNIKNRYDSPYSSESFVECKAFYLKYDLLELFHKRFVLEGLVLDSPAIYLKRYKNEKGEVVLNVSDLMPAPAPVADAPKAPAPKTSAPKTKVKKTEPTPPPASVIPEVSSSSIPIDIAVRELGLKNAKIEIIDTALDKFKEVYSLHHVRFLLSDIDLKNNTPMNINTGFGISVSEFKDGQATDKAINLDADISGFFTLFDAKKLLNPDGVLLLKLANGKLEGVQMYKELVSQGKDLTAEAKKYQGEIIANVEKAKKAAADAKNNEQLAGKIGGAANTVEKMANLASKLDKLDMGFISKAMDIGFLQDSLEFDEIATMLRVKDQKVISSNIAMKGKDMGGEGSGYTGFNTVIDYSARLIGDKKFNNNFLTKAMADEAGNVILPFTITGTTAKPKISLAKIDVKSILRAEVEKQLGPDAAVVFDGMGAMKDLAKQRIGAEVDKAKLEAQARLEAEKAELLRKAEEEKRKAEEEAKRRAAEEAKKKLESTGIKVPKF